MSELGEKLISALESAIEDGEPKVHKVSSVRQIRARMNMSVPEFSKTFGLSRRTVEKWDAQENKLSGAAKVLMQVIDKDPSAVIKALNS